MSARTKSTAHGRRHAIAPGQIKAIHAAINKAGIDDTAYRLRLKTYGAKTCKDLTWQQAEELLDSLNGNPPKSPFQKGGLSSPPLYKRGAGGDLPYADLDGRPGFATGSQCRLVAAMFAQITKAPADDPDGREKALNSFCSRITGVAALRMVRTYQVEKIVKALEAMGAVHKGGQS